MEITFDPAKNAKNIRERELDFYRAAEFDFGTAISNPSVRKDELRIESIGYLQTASMFYASGRSQVGYASSASAKRIDGRQSGMGSKYVDDLIDDDEVPELTEEDFAKMVPFSELPMDLQHTLLEIQRGNVTIRPDPWPVEEITLKLSKPVRERLLALGSGWEARVEHVLREWLDHQKAS